MVFFLAVHFRAFECYFRVVRSLKWALSIQKFLARSAHFFAILSTIGLNGPVQSAISALIWVNWNRPVLYFVQTGKRPVRSDSAENSVFLRADAPGLRFGINGLKLFIEVSSEHPTWSPTHRPSLRWLASWRGCGMNWKVTRYADLLLCQFYFLHLTFFSPIDL